MQNAMVAGTSGAPIDITVRGSVLIKPQRPHTSYLDGRETPSVQIRVYVEAPLHNSCLFTTPLFSRKNSDLALQLCICNEIHFILV